jgi:hypothetical protein
LKISSNCVSHLRSTVCPARFFDIPVWDGGHCVGRRDCQEAVCSREV